MFENLAKQIKRPIYLLEIKYLNTVFIMKTRWILHHPGNLEISLFLFLGWLETVYNLVLFSWSAAHQNLLQICSLCGILSVHFITNNADYALIESEILLAVKGAAELEDVLCQNQTMATAIITSLQHHTPTEAWQSNSYW